jgi:hypothetical protein
MGATLPHLRDIQAPIRMTIEEIDMHDVGASTSQVGYFVFSCLSALLPFHAFCVSFSALSLLPFLLASHQMKIQSTIQKMRNQMRRETA